MERSRHIQMVENAFSQVHPAWEEEVREREELQQIQERGLEMNMEARTRTLPTAEEVLNDLCQAEEEQ